VGFLLLGLGWVLCEAGGLCRELLAALYLLEDFLF
jgi:hypothetical protein